MRSPWLQLMLLFIYFFIVLLVTRLLDLILWYQNGITPTQVVNPLILKVRQIKLLLDSRGVSHTEYFEKNELVQLLQDSAEVVFGEVEQVSETAISLKDRLKPAHSISHFTGGAHFYEQVEDTRDSVWLVQVLTSNEPLLDDYSWRLICSQLEPFGVRLGIFDCRKDFRLCETKGWLNPLLLLAMPKGRKPKDKVVLQPFSSSKPQVIVDWVYQQMSGWVKHIKSVEEVQRDWLHIEQNEISKISDFDESVLNKSSESASSARSTSVQVLFLSHLLHPPLFLAALSIKFTGRVRFGMFTVKRDDTENVRKRLRLGDKKLPIYLVVTPEKKMVYGSRKLEYFNMWSMNVFLRGIQPETNDVFLLSLLLANMLVVLTMCLTSTQLWWRWAVYCVWSLVKYNLWLFTAWLISLALGRFAAFGFVIEKSLLILRCVGLSDWGALVRTELAFLSLHPLLFLLSFISFSVCVSCLIRLFAQSWLISFRTNPEEQRRPWWEVLPMDSNWVNYFFRPMVSLSRPTPASHIELEDGIEMLIERLAVPNFWLQPVVPVDYIKDLPVWRYRGLSIVSEQPVASGSNGNLMSLTKPPSLLEEIMDADSSLNFVLCCCVCSRDVASSNCISKSAPKVVPKVEQSQQPSECYCGLVPGWSGSPKHECKGPFTNPDQCQKCQDSCENLSAGRGREVMCIACVHKTSNNKWNCFRNSSCEETENDEGDASDSENVSWNVPERMLLTNDCAVCLEVYNHGTTLCGLPCGHNYHQHCILAWLQRDNHHCPVCRWPAYRLKNMRTHLHEE